MEEIKKLDIDNIISDAMLNIGKGGKLESTLRMAVLEGVAMGIKIERNILSTDKG